MPVAKGTPVSGSHQRIESAAQSLGIDRKARDAGVNNNPPTESTVLDANQQEIVAFFTNELGQERVATEGKLEKLALDRRATAGNIDLEQTRHSFSRLLNAIPPSLEKVKQDHSGGLRQAKEDEERALRHMRWFQQEHGLAHRAARYPASNLRHFALVVLIAVGEWVLLSTFYAEGSDFGLIGGVMIAMILSLANVTLAIFIGLLATSLHHKNTPRKILASGAMVICASLFLLITLGAAHYRSATNEMALQQSDSRTPSLATPGRGVHSVDVDQLKTARLAWQRFVARPIGFDDVFAWVLVVLAVLFGVFAAYKGYTEDDPYPGYGHLDRELRRCRAVYQERKHEYGRIVDAFFGTTIQEHSRLLTGAKTNIDYYQALATKSLDEVRRFQRASEELQADCNVLVARYRQRNSEVATTPRPSYFNERVTLDTRLMTPPVALTSEETDLQKRYQSAMQDFSSLAEKSDETVQQLRAEELRRLDQYFEALERDVREKLVREAAEFKG
jgi:hypothetical protein